jgi:hypothetical protein
VKTPEISFDRTVAIHRSPKFISMESLSGAGGLYYSEDEGFRVYLDPEATDEALGQALLGALDRSRFVDPRSERSFYDPKRAMRADANWEKEFIKCYGYRTRREAYANLDWCCVKMYEQQISIEPHRRDKPPYWESLPPEKTVVIPATRDAGAVGAAVRLALDRCE